MEPQLTLVADPALELRALTRRYGDAIAVAGVSFEIQAGEFVTLLGPSGSGKTTTLRMIAGFEQPDTGSILLSGRDITRLAPDRRNIGMVFQSYALFPHMTLFENIAFPLKMRGRSRSQIRAAVDRMLALVRLTGLEDRYPRQISGGQQQRVALARALVFEPPLLLMDEPLGALDRQLRRQVQTELKRIHQSLGVTIVFVTHDQEEAMFLSNRIAVMQSGRIVQQGPPQALYATPSSRFVAEFIGESNFLSGRVEAIEGAHVTVRLADQTIIGGHAAEALKAGQSVDCLIRPDTIDLASGASKPRLIGQIDLANFLGDSMELEVATPVGPMRVRTPIRAGQQGFAPGQSLELGLDPAVIRVFPVAGVV